MRQNRTLSAGSHFLREEEDCFDEEKGDIFALRRELTLLSEKYRKVAILYYIENRSCAEISSSLTISESMVKYLLFKLTGSFRVQLGIPAKCRQYTPFCNKKTYKDYGCCI